MIHIFFIQELGKFSIEINVKLNEWEKYTNFNINNQFVVIDSFQFPHFLSNSLFKQFFPYGYMSGFENWRKNYQAKKWFIVPG